jgi:hypothetical protein
LRVVLRRRPDAQLENALANHLNCRSAEEITISASLGTSPRSGHAGFAIDEHDDGVVAVGRHDDR